MIQRITFRRYVLKIVFTLHVIEVREAYGRNTLCVVNYCIFNTQKLKKVSAALFPLALGVLLMCVIKCILCVPYNLLWGYELDTAGIEPKTAEEKVFQDLEWVRKNEEECCIKLSLLKES